MNERLEDLMYESGLTAQGCWDEMDDYDKRAIEKFAELIVRECARLPFKDTMEVTTDGEIAVSNMILKHFGVE